MIAGPWGTDGTPRGCDSPLQPICRLSEGCLQLLLQFPLADCLNWDFQLSTSVSDAVAKEFAFGGMNERMRRENLCKRRQRATGGQQDRGTCDSIMTGLQFLHDLLDGRQSQALRCSLTVCQVSLRGRKLQGSRVVIGLVCTAVCGICDCDPPAVDDLILAGVSRNRDEHAPTGMHSKAEDCSFHEGGCSQAGNKCINVSRTYFSAIVDQDPRSRTACLR